MRLITNRQKTIFALLFYSLVIVAQPAFGEESKKVNVNVNVETENFMWTILKDSFYGGLFGVLVGAAGFMISGFEMDPMIMAYTAGGGILLGAGVGIWEVSTRDDIVEVSSSVGERPPAHEAAFVVPLFSGQF